MKRKIRYDRLLIMVYCLMSVLCLFSVASHCLTKAEEPKNIEVEPQIVYIVVESDKYEELQLPHGLPNNFKTFMDYRTITNTSSAQWDLQQSAETNDQGLRVIGNKFVIAVGSDYAKVGDTIRVTLDGITQIDCIVGDIKNPNDSNATGKYHYAGNGINLVEFIVDTTVLDEYVKSMGDVSYIDGLKGIITKMEKEIR